MAYRDISLFPLRRGGNARPDDQDSSSCLHANVVDIDGEQFLFWAGEDAHPADGGIKRLFRGTLYEDPFSTAGNQKIDPDAIGFNGRNLRVNPATAVATFTDFSANFPLDADTSLGARFSDLSITTYDNAGTDELRLIGIVNNHQTTGKNHCYMLKSVDKGLTWSFVQEVLAPDGGNQGTPFGLLVTLPDNSMVGFTGDSTGGKRERISTDGGITWVDYGLAVPISTVPGDINYTNMPVSRGFVQGDRVVAYLNNSQEFNDWPEFQTIAWKSITHLGNNQPWTVRKYPVSIAGPTAGGDWQFNRVAAQNSKYGEFVVFNRWGVAGENFIGSANMDDLIDTPYAHITEGFGHKHLNCKFLSWSGLWDNLTWMPISDGDTIALRYGNRYLAINSASPVFGDKLTTIDDVTDPRCHFVAKEEFGLFILRLALDPALALRHPGFLSESDKRDLYMPIEARVWNTTTPANNSAFHHALMLVGNGQTTKSVFINAETRLAIHSNGFQIYDTGQKEVVLDIVKLSP